jgi:flagella basal body P-ring formation protein FlgA
MRCSTHHAVMAKTAQSILVCAGLLAFSSQLCGAVILTPEKVASMLQRHALEYSSWKAENVEVRVLPFQPVSLPDSRVSLRVLRPLNVVPGAQSFLIAAESGGKEHARLWVKAEMRVFEDVVVSSQLLAAQDVVKPSDVRLERREISGLQARPFYAVDEVVGQQVARPIALNETLTQKKIERPTVMRRGSAVSLVYETGALRVETPGTAEEHGRIGEMIQVKNASSGKLLRGRVVDGRKVRID